MYVLRSVKNRLSRLFVLLLAVTLGACSDLDLFSPNQNDAATTLSIRTYFGVISASQSAVDITKVRLTVTVKPSGPTQTFEISVDPNQTSWDLPIEVQANSEISILVELLNPQGGVEFSGILPSIKVTSGPQPTPPSVAVFPGPPENLSITSIAVSPRDQSVLEGTTVNLSAAIVGGSSSSRALWSSDNAAVATVDENGVVRTLRPGRAVITAVAGRFSDAVTINVGARASSIEITPLAPTLSSLEQEQTFTARVLDARNEVVPGVGVTWSITDGTIATQVNAGVFKARRNGSTTITATATQGGNTLTASTTLTVQQQAVSITIAPTSKFFDAVGATQQFTVEARDANGVRVESGGVTWTSSDAAVATVSATGLVTSVGNGTATITAESGGNRAEAVITVKQRIASVTISPTAVTLTFIGDTEQLTAVARDPNGNVVNAPVHWFSQNPAIAGVDGDNGIVEANGDGTTVVFADVNGARAAAAVHVRRVATQILFDRGAFTLKAGSSQQVKAFLADERGAPMNEDTISWSSANPEIATVSSSGVVSGRSAGTTQIIAQAAGFTARLDVTVVGTAPTGGISTPLRSGPLSVLMYDPYGYGQYRNSFNDLLTQDGITITFKSSTEWLGMTQQQFASYDVIIIRSFTADATLSSNKSVWGNALSGNLVLTGLHADDHYPYSTGTGPFIKDAIRFAASGGGTGFLAFSQSNFNWLPALGSFVGIQATTQNGCGSADDILITNTTASIFTNSTSASLSNWSQSAHNCFSALGGFTSVADARGRFSSISRIPVVLVGKLFGTMQ